MDAPTVSPPRLRDTSPPLVTALLALSVLVELVWIGYVATGSDELRPRDVPAVVVGDPVVAEAFTQQYEDLPGHPFALTPATGRDRARAAVTEGRVRGALVLDLARGTDTVYLSGESSSELEAAVRERVDGIAASHGRQVRYESLGPADAPARRAHARLAVVLASLLGYLVAVGTSLRWGPTSRDVRHGLRRLLLVGGVAVVLGGATGLALLGSATGALVAALVAAASAATTFSLGALFGWAGLGLAVAAFFATAVPVFSGVDRYLTSVPWSWLSGLGIPGAGLEAATAAGVSGRLATTPTLVLTVWTATSLLVIWVARAVRGRHRVDAPSVPEGSVLGVRAWRLRVLVIVTPLTAALLVLSVVVPEHEVARAAARPSLAASTECVSTGRVRDVDDLNRIASLRGTADFRGGDVGADAELQDRRRVWLFGDTLRDTAGGGTGGYVRNSMLVADGTCLSSVLPEGGGAIIPDRADGVGYWPMSVVALEQDGYDLLYVTTQRVRTTGTGAFDFENLGLSVAVFVVPVGQTPQLLRQHDVGADLDGTRQPTWGAATALTGTGDDRWLYLYGTASPGTDEAWGYSLRVARVRPEDLLHEDRWRYWDGAGWSAEADAAVETIPAQDGVSQTLSVFEQGGRWYALSKRNDLLGSDITVWTADAPTGPWSGGTAVLPVPAGGTGQVRYMPLAHPSVFPEDGTVVASYSTNDTDPDKVADDPRLYRPHFVRVTLPD